MSRSVDKDLTDLENVKRPYGEGRQTGSDFDLKKESSPC